MKTKTNNLDNIRNFLELIYKEKNATKEEVLNFLNECLNYVFDYHKIDINNYSITFHPTKTKYLDDAEAKVEQDEKYLNVFDIYFDDIYLTFKGTKKIKSKSKKSKERYFQDEREYMADFLNFVYTMFHEFHHIIQYIKKPKAMKKWEITKISIEKLAASINSFDYNKEDKQKILLALNAHEDALDYVSRNEREANKKAHEYLTQILDYLIFVERDPEFENFLFSFFTYANAIRKDEFYFYRMFNKINAQKLAVLEQYKISANELLS